MLFAREGYAATSLEEVVTAARVTKGALYHHFSGKRELFAAVFEAEQTRMSNAVAAEYARAGDDPWAAFQAACHAFLDIAQEPGVQRIALLDAPVALGWETIRALEVGSLAMMEFGIARAIEAGRIDPRPPRPLAHLLFGALCESAIHVARSADQRIALREATDELGHLLRGLEAQ